MDNKKLNRAAQIELLDKATGEVIESVDVKTRSDLVYCLDGETVDDKINQINEKIGNLENPHTAPEIVVTPYEPVREIGSGDYTITFSIYKGNLDVDMVIITINGHQSQISEENISVLNSTGVLAVDCIVNSSEAEYHKIEVTATDMEGYEDSVTEEVAFVYPSYCFTVDADIDAITGDLVKSNNRIISTDPYMYTDNFKTKSRVVFATPYELSSIKDNNGFELLDTFNDDIQIITCTDGTNQPYHIYYSNALAPCCARFIFSI